MEGIPRRLPNRTQASQKVSDLDIAEGMIWQSGCVFVIAAVMCGYVQAQSQGFTECDAYYHSKMGQWYWEGRIRDFAADFPWTRFGIWSRHYGDKEFLYHLFLMVPVGLFGMNGVKGAHSVLCGGIFAVFYYLCRAGGVRHAWAWVIILFCSSLYFIVRLEQVRPQALNILLSLIFVGTLLRPRPIIAGIVTAVYVLSYSVPLVIPGLLAFYITIALVLGYPGCDRLSIGVALGGIVGVVVHPHFPNNIILYRYLGHTLFNIASGQNAEVMMGAEFNPISTRAFLSQNALSLGVFGLVLGSLIRRGLRGESVAVLTVLSAASLLLVLALWSTRFTEIMVPLLTLGCAWYFKDVVPGKSWTAFTKVGVLVLVLGVAVLALWSKTQFAVRAARQSAHPEFRDSGEWLNAHIAEGEPVFTAGWSEFCELFYFAPKGRYIVGLEPSFLYNCDRKTWETWVNIATLREREIEETIRRVFGSEIVFVSLRNPEFLRYALASPGMEVCFKGSSSCVLRLKQTRPSFLVNWNIVGDAQEGVEPEASVATTSDLRGGYVDLSSLPGVAKSDRCVVRTRLKLDKSSRVRILFSLSDCGSLWVDEIRVARDSQEWAAPVPDENSCVLDLTEGEHILELHVEKYFTRRITPWQPGFYCRVEYL